MNITELKELAEAASNPARELADMTRDDTLRMAREAGITNAFMPPQFSDVFERFAALVAAAEREECAKVCDAKYYQHIGPEYGEVRYSISTCAAAIRARGTK